MALRDFIGYTPGRTGSPGSEKYTVASGTTSSINSGEPVLKGLGAAAVTAMATNMPVVGTDFLAGMAATTSDETSTAAGSVQVEKIFDEDVSYLGNPKVAATWDTQAKYDALVGDRVLIDLTAGVFTVLATDGATNGCVVEPLDIATYPGKVRISFRKGLNYLA